MRHVFMILVLLAFVLGSAQSEVFCDSIQNDLIKATASEEPAVIFQYQDNCSSIEEIVSSLTLCDYRFWEGRPPEGVSFLLKLSGSSEANNRILKRDIVALKLADRIKGIVFYDEEELARSTPGIELFRNEIASATILIYRYDVAFRLPIFVQPEQIEMIGIVCKRADQEMIDYCLASQRLKSLSIKSLTNHKDSISCVGISSHRNLRYLNLSVGMNKVELMKEIGVMNQLKYLACPRLIGGTSEGDNEYKQEDIMKISSLQDLICLDLSNASVSYSAFDGFNQRSGIRALIIDDNWDVDLDSGLPTIVKRLHLSYLSVRRTGIKRDQMRVLRDRLPECVIEPQEDDLLGFVEGWPD